MHDRRLGLERIVRPRSSAVPGMNWAMPCAPFGLTACGLKRLSFQISRTNGIGGKPLASACCCMIGQTMSTNGLGPAGRGPLA